MNGIAHFISYRYASYTRYLFLYKLFAFTDILVNTYLVLAFFVYKLCAISNWVYNASNIENIFGRATYCLVPFLFWKIYKKHPLYIGIYTVFHILEVAAASLFEYIVHILVAIKDSLASRGLIQLL